MKSWIFKKIFFGADFSQAWTANGILSNFSSSKFSIAKSRAISGGATLKNLFVDGISCDQKKSSCSFLKKTNLLKP